MAAGQERPARAEVLDHGTRVYTAPGAGFGSDALLLARFARPRPGDRALDLGSGCGIVALCWHCLLYTSPSPRDSTAARMAGSG